MGSMEQQSIRKIVIVGGGTAGWMTAAAMAKILPRTIKIKLIESDLIGTIGVGEATIPTLIAYNNLLGLNEDEFIRETQGSFKLGIEFCNWGRLGERYFHGFGKSGRNQPLTRFYHCWLKMHQLGKAPPLDHYSINNAAMHAGKFMRATPNMAHSPLADINHAFHFDASLYAKFLRRFSEKHGVQRIEGRIVDTTLRGADGFIESVTLEGGAKHEGDLFIDCSGMAGLLIEKSLHAGFEDWSHWLPCNRAIAVPCESTAPLLPYTRATAHQAGWQWRIPLQHRTGNGHVFSSNFTNEAEAEATLMKNLDGKPSADPRLIKFTSGKRKKMWLKNCVAIGLAGGFMEPLESTSIHLVQTAIVRLIEFFPDLGFEQVEIDAYNRQSDFEYERIRDFLVLHYHQTARDDSEFWNYCRNMSIPASLQEKMDLYASRGRIFRESHELFAEESWLQVLLGQGLQTRGYHALVDQRSEKEIAELLHNVQSVVGKCVQAMPTHAEFIAATCAANSVALQETAPV